jgi:hypothetical protein
VVVADQKPFGRQKDETRDRTTTLTNDFSRLHLKCMREPSAPFRIRHWQADNHWVDVQYASGYYLSNTSNVINDNLNLGVGANGTNAVDERVAPMNVEILTNPQAVSGSSKTSSCVLFYLIRVYLLMLCTTSLYPESVEVLFHTPTALGQDLWQPRYYPA